MDENGKKWMKMLSCGDKSYLLIKIQRVKEGIACDVLPVAMFGNTPTVLQNKEI